MVVLSNAPGTKLYKNDGNLLPSPTETAPRVLVIGTAAEGQDSVYRVTTISAAKAAFGTSGTLYRGLCEVRQSGAAEIALLRIGATSAILAHVGDSAGTAGYTIETAKKDDSAGSDYSMYYDDSANRLVVKRNSDDLIVYDNDSTSPIDRYEVIVSGYRAAGGGPDIGSPSSMVNLEDVDPSTYAGTSFTAGTDGINLSRMKMYEKLYSAYKGLLDEDFDVLVPMDVYLDDFNVVDQGAYIGAVTPVLPSANTYPTAGAYTPGTNVDSLGKVYVEEYQGEYYFWWDLNGDGTAELYPSAGSATATTKIDGTSLDSDDFHEVNFAYQLARFLYDFSLNTVDATGVIGVRPPESASVVDRARWTGKAPTLTLNQSTGVSTIASSGDNGYGLLGNKFMAGMAAHRSGFNGGGFVLTDTEFMDGTEEIDENDLAVDIGKYISVVVDYPLLRNQYSSLGYLASYAPSYGGFYSNMPTDTAPTNKNVSNAQIVYKIGVQTLDALTGAGYVTLRQKTTGLKITDAPLATLPNSDWSRLSTVRIIKEVVDAMRIAADSYLGNVLSEGARASLQEALEKILLNRKGITVKSYRPFEIYQTADMAVRGRATVRLTIVPFFELREVTFIVNLAKS